MNKQALLITIICISFGRGSFAQGMWTWLRGSDTAYHAPNLPHTFGTQGVESPANEPVGLFSPAHWTDTSGNFWMYGGQAGWVTGAPMGDMWRYNPLTNNWTWMKGPGTIAPPPVMGSLRVASVNSNPGGRAWAPATWVDYKGDLWMYGGNDEYNDLGDMWRYNIASNTWTWMAGTASPNMQPVYGTKGVEAAGNRPGGRSDCGAAWVDSAGYLWFYGGTSQYGQYFYGDMWRYNTTTNYWAWMGGSNVHDSPFVYGTKGVPAATNTPGARSTLCPWTDAAGNFWLYGEETGADIRERNDLWKYDVSIGQWAWMAGEDTARSKGHYGNHCSTSVDFTACARVNNEARWTDDYGNFWFYSGGVIGNSWYTNDLWYFNPVSLEFTLVNGGNTTGLGPVFGTRGVAAINNNPGGRGGAVSWRSKAGELYLFGGVLNNMGWSNDLWKFTIDTNCGRMREHDPLLVEGLNSSDPHIKIYPNPFASQTQIVSDEDFYNQSLAIYNAVGQQVKQIDNISGSAITLYRDNLPPGLYFARLRRADGTCTSLKIMITDN